MKTEGIFLAKRISTKYIPLTKKSLSFEPSQTISNPKSIPSNKQHHFYFADFNDDGADDIFAQAMYSGDSHYFITTDKNGDLDTSNAIVLASNFAGYAWNATEHTTNLIDVDLDGIPELVRMANSPYVFDIDGRMVIDDQINMGESLECKLLIYHVGAGIGKRGCRESGSFDRANASLPDEGQSNEALFVDLSSHPVLGISGSGETQGGAPSTMGRISSSAGQYPEVGGSSLISWPAVDRAIIYQLQERFAGNNWKLVHHEARPSRRRYFSSVGNYRYRARACNMASGSQTCNAWSHTYLVYAYGTPGMPTNVRQNSLTLELGQTLELSWTRASGIIGSGGYYEFEEQRPGNSSYSYHSRTSSGNHIHHNITPNKGEGRYRYRFKACNKKSSRCSNWKFVTVMITSPVVNSPATGSVTISGATNVGTRLNSSNTIQDSNGLGSFQYQWLRNGNSIGGARSSSYVLTSVDVGKRLSLRISFTDGDGFNESKTSAQTTLVTDAPSTLKKRVTYLHTDALGSVVSESQ
ncbi:hypothetical protein PN836_009185 [Ningiella sp. W23]|uniref:hypothetical protein n=1 Tax=Ningiella sp. W23 TaxID=3023715 RepID=UPI00375773BF